MTADTAAGQHVVRAEGGTWYWQAAASRWDWVPDVQPTAPAQPAGNIQHVGTVDTVGIGRINGKNAAEAAAEAKAAADPASLSYEEALALTGPTFERLLNSGQLRQATGLPGRPAKGSRR